MIHQLEIMQAQLCQRLLGQVVSQLLCVLLRGEHKVMFEQPCAFLDPIFLRCLLVYLAKLDNEALFDAKDGIRGLVGVTLKVQCPYLIISIPIPPRKHGQGENLRDQLIPTLLLKHEVNMRRPPRMSPQPLQQLPHRPIMRDWVAHRLQPLEPEPAFLITQHDAPLARLVPVAVLDVIMPAAVRLPDINLDALNGVPSRVSDGTNGKHRLTRRVGGHRGAVLEEGRIVGVEGAEDGALGCAGGFGVVDVVEEEGEAEGVGEEDEFLFVSPHQHLIPCCLPPSLNHQMSETDATYIPHLAADLPTSNQKLQPGHPLVRAQPRLPRKVMQVRHQSRQQIRQPLVVRLAVNPDGIRRDVVNRQVQKRRADRAGVFSARFRHSAYVLFFAVCRWWCVCSRLSRRDRGEVRDING